MYLPMLHGVFSISVSLECCITGLWHPVNRNYVFKPSVTSAEEFLLHGGGEILQNVETAKKQRNTFS